MVGTPEFMAPEVVAGSGHDTDADWWSLGVTICELLTGHTPFREKDEEQHAHQKTYSNIQQGRYTRDWHESYYRRLDSRTASLIDGLLRIDVAMRLGGRRRGVESLRVHPFFWGLQWEAIERRDAIPPHKNLTRSQAGQHRFIAAPDSQQPSPEIPHGASAQAPAPAAWDAAAEALDKMFDFSSWGEHQRHTPNRRRTPTGTPTAQPWTAPGHGA